MKKGAEVKYSDAYFPTAFKTRKFNFDLTSVELTMKNISTFDLVEKDQITNCDAVIVVLAHDEYKEITKEKWQKIFNSSGVFIDVKSIYKKDYFTDTNIIHWRL